MQTIPKIEIKMIKETIEGYQPVVIQAVADVAKYLGYMRELAQEQFVILTLNAKHEITGLHMVSQGTLSESLVHPREVFKAAILDNAHAIVCAHNHPSGNPEPSEADITVTKQLLAAAKVLEIRILDHMIIGDTNCSLLNKRPDLDWN